MGIAYLPLHSGHTPRWLFNRMVKLGRGLIKVIIDDFGRREFIERLSDPFWFQALGSVLGFDWHSSGVTTVLTGVLNEVLRGEDLGVYLAGGKGRKALETLNELERYREIVGDSYINHLKKVSRLAARTDNILLQDGYSLYHHVIIFSEDGAYTVIQQGMNTEVKYARRYHWSYKIPIDSYITEPHKGIMTEKIEYKILNLTDKGSLDTKKTILDIIAERSIRRDFEAIARDSGIGLYRWLGGKTYKNEVLKLPRRVNWKAVRRLYEERPKTIPDFLLTKGLDRETVRALALIASLIYGSRIEWRDTLKYTFTVGGKDGVPYPVRRDVYDRLIEYFKEVLEGAEIDRRERREALRRLYKMRLI